MQSIWRKHLIICLFLGLLAIPIYFLDLASNGGGGGNWITLDFRGLIFWASITLLAIDVALSSIGIVSFPKSGALRIHSWSMVLSVILLVAGFVFYAKLLRAERSPIGVWIVSSQNLTACRKYVEDFIG
jgi:hypothetical protein